MRPRMPPNQPLLLTSRFALLTCLQQNGTLCFVVSVMLGVTACNYTDGQCYLREDVEGSDGAGGGVITTGTGGFGDVPRKPLAAGDPQSFDCNAIGAYSPSQFKFTTTVPDDGEGLGGGAQQAITPHVSAQWRLDGGFALSTENLLNILPAVNSLGAGLYNQTAVGFGYAWEKANFHIGPSLSIYSTPVCASTYCGRVAGLGLGGHLQANLYLVGPLGAS